MDEYDEKFPIHDYRCNHCGKVVPRRSDKRWIKSYCEESGKTVRLWRMKDSNG